VGTFGRIGIKQGDAFCEYPKLSSFFLIFIEFNLNHLKKNTGMRVPIEPTTILLLSRTQKTPPKPCSCVGIVPREISASNPSVEGVAAQE